MPFWKRKVDPEEEAARRDAEASLPEGWEIVRVDRERFRAPRAEVVTYGVTAHGPSGEAALVIGLGRAGAYRAFARHMRGLLPSATAWSVPLPPPDGDLYIQPVELFDLEDDPDVAAAYEELKRTLRADWRLTYVDRERFTAQQDHYLEVWAIAAGDERGPGELVLGIGQVGAIDALVQRLRGELTPVDAWAPPLDAVRRR